jgi:hypothetical protein
MKKLKRLLSLLLAVIALVSLLPRTAMADTDAEPEKFATVTVKKKIPSQPVTKYTVKVGSKKVSLKDPKYVTVKDKVYEFSHYTVSKDKLWHVTIPAYDGTKDWEQKWGNTISVVYKRHSHSYKKSHDRIFHWDQCECGYVGKKERHVDPATDADKICICNYKFSDNATLTTLWLENVVPSVTFKPDITDYTGEVITYQEVAATRITAHSFDALATIELPTDLTIKEGPNIFKIKVTAEDKTTTKTYTFNAVKPVKVEDALIGADGERIIVTPKTVIANISGTVNLSEAVEQKLIEMISTQNAGSVVFQPQFNRWNISAAEVTLNAALLDAIAKKPASLLITTPYGTTLTIPVAEVTALAAHKIVTIRVARNNTFAIVSGEEVLTLPETVVLELPQ